MAIRIGNLQKVRHTGFIRKRSEVIEERGRVTKNIKKGGRKMVFSGEGY